MSTKIQATLSAARNVAKTGCGASRPHVGRRPAGVSVSSPIVVVSSSSLSRCLLCHPHRASMSTMEMMDSSIVQHHHQQHHKQQSPPQRLSARSIPATNMALEELRQHKMVTPTPGFSSLPTRTSSTMAAKTTTKSRNMLNQQYQQQHPPPPSRAFGMYNTNNTMTDAENIRWLSSLVSTIESSLDALDDPDLLKEAVIDRDFLMALASQRPSPLSLSTMYQYGTKCTSQQRILNGQFLHRELPIRIAHRVVDLLTLPHGLSESQPIREVALVYLQYIRKFQETPLPTTVEEEFVFTNMLQSIILDHKTIPASIAQGVMNWSVDHKGEDLKVERMQEMEDALYRFFTARVGLRFLTEHYVLSSNRESKNLESATYLFPPEDDAELGCIQTNCDVAKEISKVAELVRQQTKKCYPGNRIPKIEIVNCYSQERRDFTYVPHHLHYMVAELLKNSVRACMKWNHSLESQGMMLDDIPPIRVIIAKGAEDVSIKIADQGGGIPRSLMNRIWQFAHSTSPEDELWTEFGMIEGSGARIRGFGLPLARIYARYFGGELTLKSTEGDGLDAYLHLPRLGEACESMPLRVRDSPGARDSTASI